MFVDARTLPDGTRLEADLCVIGAGAAGITLARELGGGTLRVAVLESGGDGILCFGDTGPDAVTRWTPTRRGWPPARSRGCAMRR